MKVIKTGGTLSSVLALAALATTARAETRATLDVSAGARAASNPYLVTGSSTGSAASTVEVAPAVTTSNGTSTLRLSGTARYDRYLRRYGDDISGRADLTFDQRFSERTELVLGGQFSTSMGGARDLFRLDTGAAPGSLTGTGATTGANSAPATAPTLDPTADVTVTGQRFRQYNYGATARLSSRLSARGQLTLGGLANFFDTDGTIGQPYSQIMGDAGYNHILSDRAQIGAQIGYSKVDYRNRLAGDGEVITPALTGTFRLSPTFSITGRVGASFSAIRQVSGIKSHSTAFSGQVSLCKDSARAVFCLSGARNVQATSLGGVSTVTTIAVSNNWRLSERDTLNIAGNYGETTQPAASVAQFGTNRTKLALASAVYSRRLSERLFLTVSPQFEKAWGQAIKRDANIAGMIGLRYKFGQ